MEVKERRAHKGTRRQLKPIGRRKSAERNQCADSRHPDVKIARLPSRGIECHRNHVSLPLVREPQSAPFPEILPLGRDTLSDERPYPAGGRPRIAVSRKRIFAPPPPQSISLPVSSSA